MFAQKIKCLNHLKLLTAVHINLFFCYFGFAVSTLRVLRLDYLDEDLDDYSQRRLILDKHSDLWPFFLIFGLLLRLQVLKTFQINFEFIARLCLPIYNFAKVTAKRIEYETRLYRQSYWFTTAIKFWDSRWSSFLLPNVTHEQLLYFLQMVLLLSKLLHEVFVLEWLVVQWFSEILTELLFWFV